MLLKADIEKLEELNAQIDVWIDKEEYSQVYSKLELPKEVAETIKKAFTGTACSHGLNINNVWKTILYDKFEPNFKTKDDLDERWERLLYAKLLRAKIQEKGTDCYTQRLDQVVAYLERHLPDPYQQDIEDIKLTVLYLQELSAASSSTQSSGFADRVQQMLKSVISKEAILLKKKHKIKEANDLHNFSLYHDLLSRYNQGVANFHQSEYKKAVLQFNTIISTIGSKQSKSWTEYYTNHKGDDLLYKPAVIYRAETQLKLQLAYHALKTLLIFKFKDDPESREYHDFKANLIRIQAYQLMDGLEVAATKLQQIWKTVFDGEIVTFPYPQNHNHCDPRILSKNLTGVTNQKNIKSRLLELAVEQHLNYMRKQGQSAEDSGQTWFLGKIQYVKDFSAALAKYFKAVEYQELARNGYWQQIANYLDWLINITKDLKTKNNAEYFRDLSGFFLREAIDMERGPKTLADCLFEPETVDTGACINCQRKTIELKHLAANHYDDFCEHMVNVLENSLESQNVRPLKFIERLLTDERENNDLRIRDLELRYKWDAINGHESLQELNCRSLCWPETNGIVPDEKSNFSLLKCCPFDSNTGDTLRTWDQIANLLPSRRYENLLEQWDERFLRNLGPVKHEKQTHGLYFLGLQRWNSSSPAEGYSLGGGYLLYQIGNANKVDFGIAIDPGFDFVRNLFHMGFSLDDIDIVLISHAHIDHIRDFESIVTLLFELFKRRKQHKKIHVILTLGIYKRLEYIIDNPSLRLHIEPYIIDIEREIDKQYFENLPNDDSSFAFSFNHGGNSNNRLRPVPPGEKDPNCCLRISPTRAYHDDATGYSDSFGFHISVNIPKQKPILIGYTGDTKWIYPKSLPLTDPIGNTDGKSREIVDIMTQYAECDTLIVHLGSLIKRDKKSDKYDFALYRQTKLSCVKKFQDLGFKIEPIPVEALRCEYLVRKEGHPYLIGLLRILTSLWNQNRQGNERPLVLISEFGEELRGKIRGDLICRLLHIFGNRMYLLPVDVGVNIRIANIGTEPEPMRRKQVHCVQCRRFVPIEEMAIEYYGVDEAIYCVCKTCLIGTPRDVLTDNLHQVYEVGYEPVPAERQA